ncbi:Yju3p [Sugiyamaella lignohabitans]|uniref:Yju3p n=1 Tax=Sugiyamaella lignohabitans TaxID=796027 RepID=A0A167EP96_9ASCO|nr:Yju3p [Sugiyamaella lignohabitans]ANB14309.1 Yju3p [Sugiyamaella lignohabitans]
MTVTPQESRFKTDDGLQLYVKKWLVPEGTPLRAKILFNHGFSEHMDAYDHFFPDFAARGYEIIGYDQRGAGHTSPLKKDFGNTNEYYVFNDLEELLESETKGYNGKFFMWGHSMGGAITLNYAIKGKQRERIDAYIANSPLVEVHPKSQGNPVLVAIAPFIAKIYPSYKSKVHLNFNYLTDDKARVDEYRKDPLRLGYTTAEQATGFLNRGKRLLNSVFVEKFVDKPVLVSHGTADYVNNYESTAKFFSLLKVSDKEFKTYEGWPHELTNVTQPKREQHRDDVLAWLDKHTESVAGESSAAATTTATADAAAATEATTAAAAASETLPAVPETEPEAASEATKEEAVKSVEEPVTETNTEEPTAAVEEPVSASKEVIEEPAAVKEEVVEEPAPVKEEAVEETKEEVAPEAKEEAVEEPVTKEVETPVETAAVVEPAAEEKSEDPLKEAVADATEETNEPTPAAEPEAPAAAQPEETVESVPTEAVKEPEAPTEAAVEEPVTANEPAETAATTETTEGATESTDKPDTNSEEQESRESSPTPAATSAPKKKSNNKNKKKKKGKK